MMRFLLDCLRPGRQRASCGRENSVEIQTKEKDPGNDNCHELKDLEDVVAMEEGALQRDRAQCRDSQQALESLAKRRTLLREEIERIQEQREQEGQLLLSLQEEQEELEQRVQEYDAELTRAKEELRRLQEQISSTRARVEEVHGRMGPLKHCIGETYTEITEAKQRLGELITEMIAIEACAPEATAHQATESLSMTIHSRSGEEEEDDEGRGNRVYEEENPIKHHSVENEPSEQAHDDGPEKLQRSAENLKSSGSSSFTEITLTEFKEEDASPRSITSQHTDSADLEEEDFEIVQSLMSKPVNQTASKDFDFFNPDPFVEYDVFGDERFPKVDMTEFLTGDPFKGSDPFACDNMFSDVANSPFPKDSPISEDGTAKESNLPWSPESANKDELADISNVAHIPVSSTCSQSIDSGMFEQNIPELADSEKHTSYDDVCPQVEIEITVTRDFDEELSNTLENQAALPPSPKSEDGGRFDPIVCEHHNIHESESSSTVDSSFDGDFGAAEEHPEEEPGPSYVRRNQVLYGLQRIDTSSYTSFPLSPDAFDPGPFLVSGNTDEKPSSSSSDHNAVTEIKAEMVATEDTEQMTLHVAPGNPSPPNQEIHDVKSDLGSLELKEDHFSNPNDASHNEEPSDLEEHKFGDIYFFTVRLDPGSSDASPVSPEVSERKKSEGDHASPESVDTGEFDYVAPEDEEPMQHSHEDYQEESFDEEESEVRPETPTVDMGGYDYVAPENEEPMQHSHEDHQEESFDKEKSQVRPETPTVDTGEFDYVDPEDEEPIQHSHEDYQEESFDKEKYQVRAETPTFDTGEFDYVAREDEEPIQHNHEDYQEESFDKEESEVRPETPTVDTGGYDYVAPENEKPIQHSHEDYKEESFDKEKSQVRAETPTFDTDEFDYVAPEDEEIMQHSHEDYQEESFDKEESEVRPETPTVDMGGFDYVAPEDEEPMQRSHKDYQEESFDKEKPEVRPETNTGPVEPEVKNPDSFPISLEHGDQSAGLDPFECNLFDLESNSEFKPQSENADNVDLASTLDTNLGNSNTDPVVQYLISPVSGDTGMFATDGYKLCARNPFSFDTGSIDHRDDNEEHPQPPDHETSLIMESGPAETDVQSLVLLDPVLIGNPVRAFEAKNSTTGSGRLDSGYHEFSGLDLFSPAPTDLCPVSTEMGPGFAIENLEIEVPNSTDFDAQVPDPFSPESNDTTMFDSEPEIFNPVTTDGITKDSGLGCTGSSDVLADSFSGSELDTFDPFSPLPHLTGSNYIPSNMDILVPEAVRDNSISYEDNRSSSWDSGVSQSPQIHCNSAPNTVQNEANLISPDTQNLSYSSSYSTTDIFFQSDSSPLTDVGSFIPKVEKITTEDKNSTVSVTAMEDLAEIDFFCSELSKMVASRSSDTVQQSVTEMLFGSNPDTAKFYPWDLDNSSADIKETSSPEADFRLPMLDNDEKPCLL